MHFKALEPKSIRPTQERFVPAPLPTHNSWERRAPASQPASSYKWPLLSIPQHPRVTTNKNISTQLSLDNRQSPTVTRQPRARNNLNNINNFSNFPLERFQEMHRLNSIINVGGLVAVIKDLSNRLSACKSSNEKFMVVLRFIQELEKYNI